LHVAGDLVAGDPVAGHPAFGVGVPVVAAERDVGRPRESIFLLIVSGELAYDLMPPVLGGGPDTPAGPKVGPDALAAGAGAPDVCPEYAVDGRRSTSQIVRQRRAASSIAA
jgi:hypothetical protein